MLGWYTLTLGIGMINQYLLPQPWWLDPRACPRDSNPMADRVAHHVQSMWLVAPCNVHVKMGINDKVDCNMPRGTMCQLEYWWRRSECMIWRPNGSNTKVSFTNLSSWPVNLDLESLWMWAEHQNWCNFGIISTKSGEYHAEWRMHWNTEISELEHLFGPNMPHWDYGNHMGDSQNA
jgi:hypothetical protein